MIFDGTKPINVWIGISQYSASYEIWVSENNGVELFNLHIERSKLIKTKIDEGSVQQKPKLKPFLIIPYSLGRLLFPALINALNGINIQSKNEAIIEGTLNATKEHLKDLQKANDSLFSLVNNVIQKIA